ncbi:hypothetical protein Anapl_00030 [Anas platyrhynchos]|uniref:Uncharacterized protein n=1 Tax=Anas platyrhynchos TaxID=8839 RepID=R0LTZ0_ANAPL|nr:hypothetical protein Anapl_00030 [Anas platyrhynchos]
MADARGCFSFRIRREGPTRRTVWKLDTIHTGSEDSQELKTNQAKFDRAKTVHYEDVASQFQAAWELTHTAQLPKIPSLSNADYTNGKINSMRKAVIHINTIQRSTRHALRCTLLPAAPFGLDYPTSDSARGYEGSLQSKNVHAVEDDDNTLQCCSSPCCLLTAKHTSQERNAGQQEHSRESLGESDLPFLLSSESSRELITTDSILEGKSEAQALTWQQQQPPAQLLRALTRTEQKAEPSSALNQHPSRLWLCSALTTRSRWGPTTFLQPFLQRSGPHVARQAVPAWFPSHRHFSFLQVTSQLSTEGGKSHACFKGREMVTCGLTAGTRQILLGAPRTAPIMGCARQGQMQAEKQHWGCSGCVDAHPEMRNWDCRSLELRLKPNSDLGTSKGCHVLIPNAFTWDGNESFLLKSLDSTTTPNDCPLPYHLLLLLSVEKPRGPAALPGTRQGNPSRAP